MSLGVLLGICGYRQIKMASTTCSHNILIYDTSQSIQNPLMA